MAAEDIVWRRQQQMLRHAAPGTLGGRVQSPGALRVRRPQMEKAGASPSAAGGGGGGGGDNHTPFITVGTSTMGHTADMVDYLCDGTDDEIEINAAMLDFRSNVVFLLAGTYVLGAKIAGTTSSLWGDNGAVIQAESGYADTCMYEFGSRYVQLRGLIFDGAWNGTAVAVLGPSASLCTQQHIIDCAFTRVTSHAVSFPNGMNTGRIEGCHFGRYGQTAHGLTGAGVSIAGSSVFRNKVVSNHFINCSGGAIVAAPTSGYSNDFSDNTIDNCGSHTIELAAISKSKIHGNVITDTNATTNTKDGIHLRAGCDSNSVQANVLHIHTSAKQFRHAIRIDDATCDTNLITNNDLLGSYATTSVSDAGTGTVTTAGNRV